MFFWFVSVMFSNLIEILVSEKLLTVFNKFILSVPFNCIYQTIGREKKASQYEFQL